MGVVYEAGLDQAYKAVGAKSSTTDSRADYTAVINAVNRGTKRFHLVAHYYSVNAASTTSQDDQLQAACSYFTSDVPVDAVMSYAAGDQESLAVCLQQHRVPLIDGSPTAEMSTAAFRATPLLWAPSQLTLDTLGALEPTYLVTHHWIDSRWNVGANCATVPDTRVGVVTFDRPEWRNVYTHIVAPTFQRLGHPVKDVFYVNVTGSTAQQVAQASSAVQSAVLQFASDCVDHVAFISNVAVDYLFMNVAAQQHYTPRYGLSSLEAPPVIVQNLPAGDTSQLVGALGPGWSPFADVATTNFDATAKQPSTACADILRRSGLEPTDNNSWLLALPACDAPMFLAAVLQRWLAAGATGPLLVAVDGLGNAYQPVGSYHAHIDGTAHAGADRYRGFAYSSGCTCFRYNTGVLPMNAR